MSAGDLAASQGAHMPVRTGVFRLTQRRLTPKARRNVLFGGPRAVSEPDKGNAARAACFASRPVPPEMRSHRTSAQHSAAKSESRDAAVERMSSCDPSSGSQCMDTAQNLKGLVLEWLARFGPEYEREDDDTLAGPSMKMDTVDLSRAALEQQLLHAVNSSPDSVSSVSIRNKPLLLVVAAAVYDEGIQRVLIAQRPIGKHFEGYWEFPGGKVDPGESPEQAIVRELKEELDLDLNPDALEFATLSSRGLNKRQLLMLLYVCRSFQGVAKAMDNQRFIWASFEDLANGTFSLTEGDLDFSSWVVENLTPGSE